MLDNVPIDVFKQIIEYLKNDGLSVVRMSLCSSNLYNILCGQNSSEIWKGLVESRWTKRRLDDAIQNYRIEYRRHHIIDQRAIRILEDMDGDLRGILSLNEYVGMVDGSSLVGQDYNYPSLKNLLSLRADVVDILRLNANKRSQLIGFLAARSLQHIHMTECFCEWSKICNLELSDEMKDDPHRMNSIVLERYAILLCQIQQTAPQLLGGGNDVAQSIVSQLDQIADDCRQQIHIHSAEKIMEKIEIVNDVLLHQYGFVGNEGDYYNYKNSLLLCTLESKKGIPITLCILYTCVCQRLGLKVYIVGLPGHVVLGLLDDKGSPIFLDVFRQCNLLSIQDCQRICASYNITWSPHFLSPLRGRDVFHRMLNNLGSCLFQAVAVDYTFHSDLCSQQQIFDSIHGQPPDVVMPLIESFKSKFTLSPDLLRHYRLLSRRNGSEE